MNDLPPCAVYVCSKGSVRAFAMAKTRVASCLGGNRPTHPMCAECPARASASDCRPGSGPASGASEVSVSQR